MTVTDRPDTLDRFIQAMRDDLWAASPQTLDYIENRLRSLFIKERRDTVDRIRTAYLAYNVPEGSEEYFKGIDAASAALFTILDSETN